MTDELTKEPGWPRTIGQKIPEFYYLCFWKYQLLAFLIVKVQLFDFYQIHFLFVFVNILEV